MKWLKRQHQEAVSPEAFTLLLLKITNGIVKNTSQTLEKHLDAQRRPKLPKVEEELLFFFVFALDYWIQKSTTRTQEEQRILRQAFYTHLANIVSLDTWKERVVGYARIVNMKKGDEAKLLGFGMLLAEQCGMPDHPFLLMSAPDLFTKAGESIERLKTVRLKLGEVKNGQKLTIAAISKIK